MIGHMTVKDLKRMIRDRKTLIVTVLMPVILTTILGFSIGSFMNGGVQLTPAKVALVSLDEREKDLDAIETFLSQGFFAESLRENVRLQLRQTMKELDFEQILREEVLENEKVKTFMETELLDRETAMKRLNNGELTAVVVIPEKFSYHLLLSTFFPFRNPVQIEIWQNPDQEVKAGLVEGVMQGFADSLSAAIIAKNAFLEAAVESGRGERAYGELQRMMTDVVQKGQISVEIRHVSVDGKKPVSGFQYYAAAMCAMFILFTAVYGAHYFINEKQYMTYERMILAGITLPAILSGRFLATVLFTLLQTGILVLVSSLAFQVKWGSWWQVFVLSLAVAIAIGSLAVLLSAINLRFNNERASTFFANGLVQVMALAGGSFVPASFLPEAINRVGEWTVNGVALQGYLKLMQGYSLFEMGRIFLSLLGMSAFFVIAAFGATRKREG